MEAALRNSEEKRVSGETGLGLFRPAHARELDVVPANGEPVLDILAVVGVQLLALLARDAQALSNRHGVKLIRRIPIHVGAGERALLAEEAARRVPDLGNHVGGPGDAAVN